MTTPKHIVAVAGLVTNAHNQALMVLSPRGDWEFPGGQVEEGEDLIEALKREVLEETGVTIAVRALAAINSNVSSHIVMFDFVCDYVSGQLTTSPESLRVEWVNRDEAVSRIQRPPIRDRFRRLWEFDGKILYRAYSYDAHGMDTEYDLLVELPV